MKFFLSLTSFALVAAAQLCTAQSARADTPLEMSDAGHFTGLGKLQLETFQPAEQSAICDNCMKRQNRVVANQDSIVVRFAHYDTYFMDLIDNATHHDEHQLKFKLHF